MNTRLFVVCLTLCLSVTVTKSQGYMEDDKLSTDIERIVDNVISNVEYQVEKMANRHSIASSEMGDDSEYEEFSQKSESVTFNGDTEIAKDDTISSDIVIKNGTLTIYGVVLGDAAVINGTLNIRSGAIIKGNARAINGSVIKDENAIVEGYIEESSNSANNPKRTQRTKYSYSFRPNADWYKSEMIDEVGVFRYNRVEGVFIGIGNEKKYYWDGSKLVNSWGSIGYGFGMHKWRMQLGVDRQFATTGGLYDIGVEIHSLTDSKDDWIMTTSENTVAALLVREDYRDYFQREGYSFHASRYTREEYSTMIDVRYVYDRYATLYNTTQWALFGGKNAHRFNPNVQEGIMRSVKVGFGLSTVERFRKISDGWNIYASIENAGGQLGGDFSYTQALLDVRSYFPVMDDDQMSGRIRLGSHEGALYTQRVFEIGGANTLPGFGFKELSGNRMILMNLEYQNMGLFDDLFFWPSRFRFIVFTDACAINTVATNRSIADGLTGFSSNQIKTDVGFGIGIFDDARFGFAWRTDVSAPVSVFFRINKAF